MEKSLKINSKILFIFLLIFSLWQFLGCKKQPILSNSTTFLKTYQTELASLSVFLEQLPDGSFIFISSDGSMPLMIKTDKYGNLIWKKTIQKNCFPNTSMSNVYTWNALMAKDAGHFLCQANGIFTIIDTLGNSYGANLNSSYQTQFGTTVFKDSKIIVSSCDGEFSGASSVNKIYVFDDNLVLQKKDSFLDTRIGGKTLFFFINGISPSGSYIIAGQKFPNIPFTFSDNSKTFAAIIPHTGKVTETIIDVNDKKHSDVIAWQTSTNDSGLILLNQRTDKSTGATYPAIERLDKKLDTVWEKEFPINFGTITLWNMTACRDGGFIIVGNVGNSGYSNTEPYMLKIDKDGNKIWDRTITSAGSSILYYGTDLIDGGYAFVGTSNYFGSGLNGNGVLFIKTDANGNY